jgi:hypothetical protein
MLDSEVAILKTYLRGLSLYSLNAFIAGCLAASGISNLQGGGVSLHKASYPSDATGLLLVLFLLFLLKEVLVL